MKVIETDIPDVKIIEPTVFGDDRGFFFESFNHKLFEEAVGYQVNFVQDNHSKSSKGVLRGLHYQLPPYAQGKLVRCVAGEVFDVAVDIRKSSPTFGRWVGVIISEENKKQVYIPEGFAHGFYVISDLAEVLYKTTAYWSKEHERSLLWSDIDINVDWPISTHPILSEKDACAVSLKKIKELNHE
ncbi:dTDP-4-dehydrorhamnose 3,5-epimerase [Vibrio cholerae]|uniref:dTDP-4-dehydrorhamnose 3,5-epimerase n=1 Tax=Vibrio cholerae TaxID=666 RepID=UPI003F9D0739